MRKIGLVSGHSRRIHGRSTPHMMSYYRLSVIAIASLLPAAGCGLQAKIIQSRHWDLNETIRETNDEQLLLNLVRLRYDETPFFLQMSSISTQFSAQSNVGASATFNENVGSGKPVPDIYGLNAGASYSESPVVTWSLPDSSEYYGRLLAPMSSDQLTVLAQSGWNPERVFRVGVKKMNRLRNMDFSVGQGAFTHDTYDEFVESLRLIEELRRDDLVDFAYGVKSSMGAGKIPMEKMDVRAIPPGLQYGLQFMTRDNPNEFEPLKFAKPLFLRFSKRSDEDTRAQRLRALLNLDPEKYSFGIVDTTGSGKELLLSESGRLSQVYDPDARFPEVVLNNRSIMEVLFFASTYVQVPADHLARGYVAECSPIDPDWLRIHVATIEPARAWLKIRYGGHWFYIAADDVTSRRTFALLDALFASVVGNVPGGKPLLTLPVK